MLKVSPAPLSASVVKGLNGKIEQGVSIVIPCMVGGRMGYIVIPFGQDAEAEREANKALKDVQSA